MATKTPTKKPAKKPANKRPANKKKKPPPKGIEGLTRRLQFQVLPDQSPILQNPELHAKLEEWARVMSEPAKALKNAGSPGRPYALDAEKLLTIFKYLVTGSSYGVAAAAAGVLPSTLKSWRDRWPTINAACEELFALGTEGMVAEANRRAFQGVLSPITHQGIITGARREFSDTLAMFLLKQRDASFRETTRTELTGKDGGPLEYTKIERVVVDPHPHEIPPPIEKV